MVARPGGRVTAIQRCRLQHLHVVHAVADRDHSAGVELAYEARLLGSLGAARVKARGDLEGGCRRLQARMVASGELWDATLAIARLRYWSH